MLYIYNQIYTHIYIIPLLCQNTLNITDYLYKYILVVILDSATLANNKSMASGIRYEHAHISRFPAIGHAHFIYICAHSKIFIFMFTRTTNFSRGSVHFP